MRTFFDTVFFPFIGQLFADFNGFQPLIDPVVRITEPFAVPQPVRWKVPDPAGQYEQYGTHSQYACRSNDDRSFPPKKIHRASKRVPKLPNRAEPSPEIPESKAKKKPALPSVPRNAAAISLTNPKKKSNFMNYGTVRQSLTVLHKVIFQK